MPSKESVTKLLFRIKEELNSVKKSDIIGISQIAEKTWVAYKNYVAYMNNTSVGDQKKTINLTKELSIRQPDILRIYEIVMLLHIVHYDPEGITDSYGIISSIDNVRTSLMHKLKEGKK